MKETFTCCLCGRKFYGFGNNPWGAIYKNEKGEIVEPTFSDDARCCEDCDNLYVIPGRMYKLYKNKEEKKNENN